MLVVLFRISTQIISKVILFDALIYISEYGGMHNDLEFHLVAWSFKSFIIKYFLKS